MPVYREQADGTLKELRPIFREAADGSLVEIGAMYRELADGSLVQVYAAGGPETLFPVGDVSTGGWSDSGFGDGNGDLWDELDESPDDGDTTAINRSTGAGTDITDTFRVLLSNPAERHGTGETHTIYVTGRVQQNNANCAGSATIVAVRLYDGGTLIDENLTGAALGGTHNEFTFDMDPSGLSNWDDLRVEVEVDLTSPQCSEFEFGQPNAIITQVRLGIEE